MQRLLFVGMLLASLAAAPAAQGVQVCAYNVRFVLGTFCPIHTGDQVCLSQNAAIGPCEGRVMCYGGHGFFCQAQLEPRSGPQEKCPFGSKRPTGMSCYRPMFTPGMLRTPTATGSPEEPTFTPTVTQVPSPSSTIAPTFTRTATSTATAPLVSTATATAILSPTGTPTGTAAATLTATATGTNTASATSTATPPSTATNTIVGATSTATPPSTATNTVVGATSTATPPSTATNTLVGATSTATPPSTATNTVVGATSTATAPSTATRTNTASATSTATAPSTATNTIVGATSTATPPSTATNTVVGATSTATPPSTATRTNTASATSTATPPSTATNTIVAATSTATPPSTATRTSTSTNTPLSTATSTSTNTVPPSTATNTIAAATSTATPPSTATRTNTPPATSTATATATNTTASLGTHVCTLGTGSGINLGTQALPLALNPTGTVQIACGSPNGAGKAACACNVQSFNVLVIPAIGDVCINPATCPSGEIDCDGGNAEDVDLVADHNIGTCTDDNSCAASCTAYCGGLGANYARLSYGCEGFCQGGTNNNNACTLDSQCPGGACTGGEPVAHAGKCNCNCQGEGLGSPAAAGSLACEVGTQINVELPSNGVCDQTVPTIQLAPVCGAVTTAQAKGLVKNANNTAAKTIPPVGGTGTAPDIKTGSPISCSTFATSTLTGLKLTGHLGFFDSTLGDIFSTDTFICQ